MQKLPYINNITTVKQTLSFDTISLATKSRWEQASGKGIYNYQDTYSVEFDGLSDVDIADFENLLSDPSNIYIYAPPPLFLESKLKISNGWKIDRYAVVAPRGLVGCEVNKYGLNEHIETGVVKKSQYVNKLSINLVRLAYFGA